MHHLGDAIIHALAYPITVEQGRHAIFILSITFSFLLLQLKNLSLKQLIWVFTAVWLNRMPISLLLMSMIKSFCLLCGVLFCIMRITLCTKATFCGCVRWTVTPVLPSFGTYRQTLNVVSLRWEYTIPVWAQDSLHIRFCEQNHALTTLRQLCGLSGWKTERWASLTTCVTCFVMILITLCSSGSANSIGSILWLSLQYFRKMYFSLDQRGGPTSQYCEPNSYTASRAKNRHIFFQTPLGVWASRG